MGFDATVFSASYGDARAKFRDAVIEAGGRLEAHMHPHPGPDGETLAMDIGRLGADDAPALLVVNTGIHGIEGFAGSGVLVGWLRDGGFRVPSSVRLVLVHAHNPWGFAYRSRGNEDNIDLNRNYRDFGGPVPDNPGYRQLHPAFCPADVETATVQASFAALERFRARDGEQAYSDAMSAGQYSHPDGLFYGGAAPAWSNRVFRSTIAAAAAGARRIGLIDLHTGIGGFGETVFLCFEPAGSPARARARAWWGDRAVDLSGVDHPVLAQYQGTMLDAFGDMLAPGREAELTRVVVEFGTRGRLVNRRALMTDRWARFAAAPEARAAAVQVVSDAFFPSEPEWRIAVHDQGIALIDQAIAGLAA